MNPILRKIIKDELKLLKKLLNSLENQYNLLTSVEKDIVEISKVSEEIDDYIKAIATLEIEKKNVLQGKSLSILINNSSDEEIKENYKETLLLLDAITEQKNTNHLFIKQQLFFTKSLIRAITPKRNAEIYDSFGKIKK